MNPQKERSLPPGLVEVVKRRRRAIVIVPPVVLLGLGIFVLLWFKGTHLRVPSPPREQSVESAVATGTEEGLGPSDIQASEANPSVSDLSQVPPVERDVPREAPRKAEPEGEERPEPDKKEADRHEPFPQGLEHLWRARSYEQRGEYDKAIEEYMAFLEFREDPRVLNRVAVLYLRLNDFEEAERFLQRALSLSPDNPGFLINYAVALAKKGNAARAEQVLMKVLERDPDNPDALFNLALLMEREGNLEGARELYKKLSLLGDPSGKEGLRRLGFRY